MPLVYYAAELKPYSMDVLACGLIVLFLLKPPQHRVLRWSWVLLPFFCLGSYAAIFLFLLPLYNLIHDCYKQRRWLPELSLYLAGSILALSFVYFFDFRVSTHHLWKMPGMIILFLFTHGEIF